MILDTLKPSKALPEDVLAIFRDDHRHQCEWDPEADPDIELTLDSTVEDWRYACDLVDWKRLANALNERWKVAIPMPRWQAVLTPPKKRKLKDVCELLASHIRIERVVSPTLFGRACAPAGVFFAVRELLARDGADVTELRPSTALSNYSHDHYHVLAGPISQLAPGLLPPIKISCPEYDRASCALTICFLGLGVSIALLPWTPFCWIPFAIGVLVCRLWTWHVARHGPPAKVSCGELRTIRDVCTTLAAGVRT